MLTKDYKINLLSSTKDPYQLYEHTSSSSENDSASYHGIKSSVSSDNIYNDLFQKSYCYTIKSIGVPKECDKNESRVALTASAVEKLVKNGFIVNFETNAGQAANYLDDAYHAAGAKICDKQKAWSSDVILKVLPPKQDEVILMNEKAILLSFIFPNQNKDLLEDLRKRCITAIAIDCIPRISRAQSFDALSSMSSIAGYKAVIDAAYYLGRFLSGQITAGGKIPPAKVLIIGCGVAGLSALATAKSLGAIVYCFDTRPSVKEQVESLGGHFITVKEAKLEEGVGGYAKLMSQEFYEKELETIGKHSIDSDIIITAALIPGSEAPILITKEMVKQMKHGSVIIDLSAEMGGNVETIRKNEIYESDNKVIHIGLTNFPSRLPTQASHLYSNNISALLLYMFDKEACHITLNMNDDIIKYSLVTHENKILWPHKTELSVSESQEKTNLLNLMSSQSSAPIIEDTNIKQYTENQNLRNFLAVVLAMFLITGISFFNPSQSSLKQLIIFCLSGVIGYLVVWGVTPSLHTPLMSVTNSISGLTAMGALLALKNASDVSTQNLLIPKFLISVAVFISSINIGGGFTITYRMLNMFRKSTDPLTSHYTFSLSALFFIALFMLYKLIFRLHSLFTLSYLFASLCCVYGIRALSSHKTSNLGNIIGMLGVTIGLFVTLIYCQLSFHFLIISLVITLLGIASGIFVGRQIKTTDLPQTVAAFHSFVGMSAMFTSLAHFLKLSEMTIHINSQTLAAAIIGSIIGGITLTGSLVAFGKLEGVLRTQPINLYGKNYINLIGVLLQIYFVALFISPNLLGYANKFYSSLSILTLSSLLSLLQGWHLIDSVGGGDMPVCIALLNSYSGWALAAEGFMLNNLMLLIVGALIGFSGGILSYIMCISMNRSIYNVLFGGYNIVARSTNSETVKEHYEATIDEVAHLIINAKSIVIVPGYGMAVARAQHALADLAKFCRHHGILVRFIIHPVAGRMPGHMNVLLAEAGIPYDWVFENDDNLEIEKTDISLVVGANDITNSSAEEDPNSIIAGMPVVRVWLAKKCVFIKRTMGSGYSDLDNPVFYKKNTLMLLGDAKNVLHSLLVDVKALFEY